MGGKRERKRSTSPKWKPRPWPVAKAVVEKQPRIRSASLGPREKKNYEWNVRRMTKRIPMWWPFYRTLCRHLYRRDLIRNTFICEQKARSYSRATTAAIVLWASMQIFVLYRFHKILLEQLQYTTLFIHSVTGDPYQGPDPPWPFGVPIFEQVIGWGSGIVSVVSALVCWLTTTEPRQYEWEDEDEDGHVDPYCCVEPTMQLYEQQEQDNDNAKPTTWRVPFLGGWLSREWDRIRLYECLEQRHIYLERLNTLYMTGLLSIFAIGPYGMGRIGFWIWSAYREDDATVVPRFSSAADVMFLSFFDLMAVLGTLGFCREMILNIPWRQPVHKHSRQGECCRRHVTKYTVAAWRHQMPQTTTIPPLQQI